MTKKEMGERITLLEYEVKSLIHYMIQLKEDHNLKPHFPEDNLVLEGSRECDLTKFKKKYRSYTIIF